LLTRRLDQEDRGEVINPLFEALKEHNQVHSRRGSSDVEGRWRHPGPTFQHQLTASLTTDDITRYVRQRQTEGAVSATVSRELATLRRMFKLAQRCTPPKVRVAPYVALLKENNVRKGFLEDDGFSRLAANAKELWMRTFLELAFHVRLASRRAARAPRAAGESPDSHSAF
jgi:hypothetical protein